MIIAIDFDGTISRGPYPAINGLQPLAANTINALALQGHFIIINTCRNGDLLAEAVNFLRASGIHFDLVNENNPESIAEYGGNTRKIFAHVYIDDRNLGGFPGWPQAYKMIYMMETAAINQEYDLYQITPFNDCLNGL
jgi:hypothetical protein